MAFKRLEAGVRRTSMAPRTVRVGSAKTPKDYPVLTVRFSKDLAEVFGAPVEAVTRRNRRNDAASEAPAKTPKQTQRMLLSLAIGEGADFGKLQITRGDKNDPSSVYGWLSSSGSVVVSTVRAPVVNSTLPMQAATAVEVDEHDRAVIITLPRAMVGSAPRFVRQRERA